MSLRGRQYLLPARYLLSQLVLRRALRTSQRLNQTYWRISEVQIPTRYKWYAVCYRFVICDAVSFSQNNPDWEALICQ